MDEIVRTERRNPKIIGIEIGNTTTNLPFLYQILYQIKPFMNKIANSLTYFQKLVEAKRAGTSNFITLEEIMKMKFLDLNTLPTSIDKKSTNFPLIRSNFYLAFSLPVPYPKRTFRNTL